MQKFFDFVVFCGCCGGVDVVDGGGGGVLLKNC